MPDYGPPPDPAFDPDLAPPPSRSAKKNQDRHLVGSPGAPLVGPGGEPIITSGEGGVGGGEPPPEVADDSEPPDEVQLTPQEQMDLRELINVGRRLKEISVYGHSVVIQTLNMDDDIEVGRFTKPYLGSDAYGRAHQKATCAAAIVTIDGKRPYTPLEHTPPEELFKQRADRIGRYYPLVMSKVYRAVVELEAETAGLLEKLGKSSG